MKLICLIAVIMAVTSCIGDLFEQGAPVDGAEVFFGLSLPEIDEVVVTRAEASDIEKVIYTLRMLAFDNDGNCFYNEEIYDGYDSKTPYGNSHALGIPVKTGQQYENCTVWVIANVGIWTGAEGSYDFSKVSTLSELEATYGYRLLQNTSAGQRDCIPMTGKAEGVNMTQARSIGDPVNILMERVLARVSFKVDVKDGLEFYFNSWTVESIPRYTYVLPNDEDLISSPDENFSPYYPSNEEESSLVTYGVKEWLSSTTASDAYGFYMYENRRGGRLLSPEPDNLQGDAADYADEIRGLQDATGDNPKFKTLYAPENASFLILTGLIRETATQNVTSFTYKIALGANNTNDYNIERNHSYVYNIHINGTTYDDISVDVFDSRVHKAYSLQISAPYSDKMDAHYDKRYLDIVASPGDLELQFYPTQEDAENGTNPIDDNGWIVLSEMDTYNIDIDPEESTKKTATLTDIAHKEYYIYTQENLSSSARSVVLRIKHTPLSGSSAIVQEPVYRYYTYTQAGVIEVNGIYVESYEEYAMNLDPYETAMPTTGLQWGWSLVKSGNSVTQAWDFTGSTDADNGLNNTKAIINTQGEAFSGVDINSLYNNYAARYCYNKNKREADGSVKEENIKWYLPSINELTPLTGQVTGDAQDGWTPITMKEKGYWSSSVPTENATTGMPDNFFWGEFIWNIFVGDYIERGSEYEFRNVAESAMDGQTDKFTIDFKDIFNWRTYTAEVYYQRATPKFVRAVREKE